MQEIFPGDALLGLYCSCFRGRLPSVWPSASEINSVGLMLLYTLVWILLLTSAEVSSMNTSKPVPVVTRHAQAITLPPPSLIDEVVCFGWGVIYFLLHNFLPSLWYRLIFICPEHLAPEHHRYLMYIFANCNLPILFLKLARGLLWWTHWSYAGVESSLEGRLWHIYGYIRESVLDLLNSYRDFSSPSEGFFRHPLHWTFQIVLFVHLFSCYPIRDRNLHFISGGGYKNLYPHNTTL